MPADEYNLGSRDASLPTDHIICIDGTGNNQIRDLKLHKISNVAKTSCIFEPKSADGKRNQAVLYQPGLGSYRDLHKTNDLMLFFGFPRGVYVARMLASFIADVGIYKWQQDLSLNPNNVKEGKELDDFDIIIEEIFNEWSKAQNKTKLTKHTAFLHKENIAVPFIDVWDTVSSIGKLDIGPFTFHSDKYVFSEQIDNRDAIHKVAHACAVSEHRQSFPCAIYGDGSYAKVNQTLFPGFYTRVGGASDDPGNTSSEVTLIWMVDKFRLLLDVNESLLMQFILRRHGTTPAVMAVDSKIGVWIFLGDEDRAKWSNNVRLHIITNSVESFRWYTGIAQMPNLAKSVLAKVWKTLFPANTPEEGQDPRSSLQTPGSERARILWSKRNT
ncbi:hypothetical protein B0T24DRAFT_716855 [Lasiosphaeria ovina]|uniref:T6SS Phospholipase effector Tle1-like catalytic domain-containing protein n=1 Tax=Lasiosphaeria ovina TaxID=92902 RepID=A0AAE0KM80_9PEZI|nr:hypothetical protein B0T24DRAFT_716855 [Lasiosphaeria ovina]